MIRRYGSEEVALRFRICVTRPGHDRGGAGGMLPSYIVHHLEEGGGIFSASGAATAHQRANPQTTARECAGLSQIWVRSAAFVVAFLEGDEQMVALERSCDLAGVGGNAGTQTLAGTVRELAMKSLLIQRWAHMARDDNSTLNGPDRALRVGRRYGRQLNWVRYRSGECVVACCGCGRGAIRDTGPTDQDQAVASGFCHETPNSMGFLASSARGGSGLPPPWIPYVNHKNGLLALKRPKNFAGIFSGTSNFGSFPIRAAIIAPRALSATLAGPHSSPSRCRAI